MKIQDETKSLFGVGRWGHIETEAENAWLEGKDADSNPYSYKYQNVDYWCWYNRWKLMNMWC